jgi:hypothetical protein
MIRALSDPHIQGGTGMKTIRICALALAGAAALGGMTAAVAGDETKDKAAKKEMGAPTEADMEAWAKMNQPGPQHAMLKKLAGDWKTTVKLWMDPSKEPEVSEGSASATMVLDGRYLQETFKGSMMGSPFQGMGMMGYDNNKKEFVHTWMDSMSTGVMVSTGTYDEATKTLTMKSESYDPMMKAQMKYKMVTRIVDDNTHVFEMWSDGPGGKDMKTMEITYSRS